MDWAWYQENLSQCDNGYVPQQYPFQFFIDTHSSSLLRAPDSPLLLLAAFVK